jgi:hypothetical protein
MTDLEVDCFDGPTTVGLHSEMVAIYRSVFAQPPFNDSERDVG